MKRIYLILFSFLFFSIVYGRDPDIPLTMNATLPSIVYFSRADSMSTMLLYPLIYPDTMNRFTVVTDPYFFKRFAASISFYKNNFLYNAKYFFRNDLVSVPMAENGIEFKFSNAVSNDLSFFLSAENKSMVEKHFSSMNLYIFKHTETGKVTNTTNIKQIIYNEPAYGVERLLRINTEFHYEFVKHRGVFFNLDLYDYRIIPSLGYSDTKHLYHKIDMGIELMDKKINPYANMQFYFYKGRLSLFYIPRYGYRDFFNTIDSIPNTFVQKLIYSYEIKRYSGFDMRFKGIGLFGSYGIYKDAPYIDTSLNSVMTYEKIPLLKSGIYACYEGKTISFSFLLSHIHSFGDKLTSPEFFSSIRFNFKKGFFDNRTMIAMNFDYPKSRRYRPSSLLISNVTNIALLNNLILKFYEEYNPYYTIYGESNTLPAYKYGILIRLKQIGF